MVAEPGLDKVFGSVAPKALREKGLSLAFRGLGWDQKRPALARKGRMRYLRPFPL